MNRASLDRELLDRVSWTSTTRFGRLIKLILIQNYCYEVKTFDLIKISMGWNNFNITGE